MRRNPPRRPETLIATCELRKTYKRGREEVQALRGVNLEIEERRVNPTAESAP